MRFVTVVLYGLVGQSTVSTSSNLFGLVASSSGPPKDYIYIQNLRCGSGEIDPEPSSPEPEPEHELEPELEPVPDDLPNSSSSGSEDEGNEGNDSPASSAAAASLDDAATPNAIYSTPNSNSNPDPNPNPNPNQSCARAKNQLNTSFSKSNSLIRRRLSQWTERTSRILLVDNFGDKATTLMAQSLEKFDLETIHLCGLINDDANNDNSNISTYRMKLRKKLTETLTSGVTELFDKQITHLQKSTLKKFNLALLKKIGTKKDVEMGEDELLLRAHKFRFDEVARTLEVEGPPGGLTLKITGASTEMGGMLGDALGAFESGTEAQFKRLKKTERKAAKEKKIQPKEKGARAVNFGLGLVAMFRPDGFGSLQAFGGWTGGLNSVTVGLHNDADSPESINQLGGQRPPLLRLQPKINVDIDL
ncbi:hypothetical protein ScalyP_jg8808 [Parmales sp. scaly parma]|nr:hypothetical protein ScalyP_jg8808 [Parmales sp. scaly parma]